MTPARKSLENAKCCFLVALFFALPISKPAAILLLMAFGLDPRPIYLEMIGA